MNPVDLLPNKYRREIGPMCVSLRSLLIFIVLIWGLCRWFPSLAITYEFKHRVPAVGTPNIHSGTVGLYVRTGIMVEGRHDLYTEVWTAPCGIGDTATMIDPDWRDKQVCLVVANQVAMTMPGSVNSEKGRKAEALRRGQGNMSGVSSAKL